MHSVISWCVDVRLDAHGVSCAPSLSCVCTWTRDVSHPAVFHPIRVPKRGILIRSTAHELLKLTHGSGASLEEWEGRNLVVRTTLTNRGQRGKCSRSGNMTEMLQIRAGTSELNEKVQEAEARATEAERQA